MKLNSLLISVVLTALASAVSAQSECKPSCKVYPSPTPTPPPTDGTCPEKPSEQPSSIPSAAPTGTGEKNPSESPSSTPTLSQAPTKSPVTPAPTDNPTDSPVTPAPTDSPTDSPVTPAPTDSPTDSPVTPAPTDSPTDSPVTPAPTDSPTDSPVTGSPTKSPVTGSPTTPLDTCGDKSLDVCIAIDMSGSVCTPSHYSAAAGCRDCPNECYDNDSSLWSDYRDTCCPNFFNVKDFSKRFINLVHDVGDHKEFSVVYYADNSYKKKTSSNDYVVGKTTALSWIDNLDYSGGWTITGAAIEDCHESLMSSNAENKFLVLITDGAPTKGYPGADEGYIGNQLDRNYHHFYATSKANNVRADGIGLLPVVIETVDAPYDNGFMETLSYDQQTAIKVTSFADLGDTATMAALTKHISCDEADADACSIIETRSFPIDGIGGVWYTSGGANSYNSGDAYYSSYGATSTKPRNKNMVWLSTTGSLTGDLSGSLFSGMGTREVTVEFDACYARLETNEKFHVEYTTNGSTWITLNTYVASSSGDLNTGNSHYCEHDISEKFTISEGSTSALKVRFRNQVGNGEYDFVWIDNTYITWCKL